MWVVKSSSAARPTWKKAWLAFSKAQCTPVTASTVGDVRVRRSCAMERPPMGPLMLVGPLGQRQNGPLVRCRPR